MEKSRTVIGPDMLITPLTPNMASGITGAADVPPAVRRSEELPQAPLPQSC